MAGWLMVSSGLVMVAGLWLVATWLAVGWFLRDVGADDW